MKMTHLGLSTYFSTSMLSSPNAFRDSLFADSNAESNSLSVSAIRMPCQKAEKITFIFQRLTFTHNKQSKESVMVTWSLAVGRHLETDHTTFTSKGGGSSSISDHTGMHASFGWFWHESSVNGMYCLKKNSCIEV